jgi:hypothetical protein
MDMYMSPRMPSPLEPSRLRRRVIVELTTDELPLLDAAEGRHGSKRAAVIAGLRAEADAVAASARDERAEHEATRAAARTKAAHAKDIATLVRDNKALETKVAKLVGERDAARLEIERLETEVRAAYEQSQAEFKTLFEDIQAVEDRLPKALYCGRCNAWAPEYEWAWRADGSDEIAYHEPCGDHGSGVLSDATWLARRPRGDKKPAP